MDGSFKFNLNVKAQSEEAQSEDLTLCFTAITNVPIVEMQHDGKSYKLTVDLDSTSFKATKLYKNHEMSADTVIAKIIDHKMVQREDGFKEIAIKTKFFDDITDSHDIYKKYKNGLLDSVSIGIKNVSQFTDKEGNVFYKGGEIYEVSAVYEGRDPNAKIADSFQKIIIDRENQMLENQNQQELIKSELETFKTQLQNKDLKDSEALGKLESMIEVLSQKIELMQKDDKSEAEAQAIINMGTVIHASPEPVHSFNISKSITEEEFNKIKIDEYGEVSPDILDNVLSQGTFETTARGKVNIGEYSMSGKKLSFCLGDKWARYKLDEMKAKEEGVKLVDVIMERRKAKDSDTFEVTKTTDITSVTAEPRDTSALWDLFKRTNSFLGEVTYIDRSYEKGGGKKYEYSIEGKPFDVKVHDEGGQVTYLKYEPKKQEVGFNVVEMGVQFTYEAQWTADIDMRAHISAKMIKDFLNGMETIYLQGDSGNRYTGIYKITTNPPTKDTTFLKTPNAMNFIGVRKSLREAYYNLDNAKILLSPYTADKLSVTLRHGLTCGAPENKYLISNGRIYDTPVVLTDGLKTDEGIYGDLKNCVFVNYCKGLDLQVFIEDNRDVKINIFFSCGFALADNKSIVTLATA